MGIFCDEDAESFYNYIKIFSIGDLANSLYNVLHLRIVRPNLIVYPSPNPKPVYVLLTAIATVIKHLWGQALQLLLRWPAYGWNMAGPCRCYAE